VLPLSAITTSASMPASADRAQRLGHAHLDRVCLVQARHDHGQLAFGGGGLGSGSLRTAFAAPIELCGLCQSKHPILQGRHACQVLGAPIARRFAETSESAARYLGNQVNRPAERVLCDACRANAQATSYNRAGVGLLRFGRFG
jgi:hypothetical protein